MKFSGEALAAARADKQLTQEELAGLAGVSTYTVSRLERDENVPTLATLTRLARALDADPQSLLAGDGAPA